MHERTRGQSGLDRLLGFVLAVIVLVAVLPTALGLAGIDVRRGGGAAGGQPAAATPTPEPASLQVLNVSGAVEDPVNSTIGAVRITVTKVGSAAPVDAADLSVTWAGRDVYYLTPVGHGGANSDGAFGVEVAHVSDAGGTKLAETGDRATLTFDVGSDDVDGVPEFGRPLREGATVDVVLSTAAGKTTTVTVEVPESLDGKRVVGL